MQSNRRTRGFTLVELMVVVVILGVLAVLALFAYRKYTTAARNSEAVQFIGAIRAAEESYFQSFGQYCGTPAGVLNPVGNVPFDTKAAWDPPANSPWKALGVQSPGRVWFQYYLAAGRAGEQPADNPSPFLNGEIANRPWYWVGACSDFNGNGQASVCGPAFSNDNLVGAKLSFFEANSLRGEVVSHHEGE